MTPHQDEAFDVREKDTLRLSSISGYYAPCNWELSSKMKHETLCPPLYKYRDIGHNTLDMLATDQIFFADPTTFNDPLDVKPSLDPDISSDELAQLLGKLVSSRIDSELRQSANSLGYRGSRTRGHIEKQVAFRTREILASIRRDVYNTSNGGKTSLTDLLVPEIEIELVRQYEKGVASLAERWDCPLMWSHYGDQHRGLCLGFSEIKEPRATLLKVDYSGGRLVSARDVLGMINGDAAAREKVDKTVLATKAPSWEYEHEWRLVDRRGLRNSPLELDEVTFGLRCSDVTKFYIMTTLVNRKRAIKYFEIFTNRASFNLERRIVNYDKISVELPRVHINRSELFSNIPPLPR